jgi:outer membrane murein-binding lipoprotein Lpp
MMRKEVLGPVLAALLVGAVLGYFAATGSQAAQIAQLQSQVSDLTGQKSSLETQLTSAWAQITNLTARIATLSSEKVIMQTQINGWATEKQGLQTRVIQLNSTIQQLNGQIASLNLLLDTYNATIATLRATQTALNVSILGVYFSPKGGCASAVAYWLGRANHTVHVLIYSFTLDSIGDSVLATYRRGVDVKIVFEKSQVSKYSEFFRLAPAGVPVRNDTNPGDMHMKVAIIDGYIVLVGSFNWSAAAENTNNEVLLVIKSAELATALENQFQRIWTTGR